MQNYVEKYRLMKENVLKCKKMLNYVKKYRLMNENVEKYLKNLGKYRNVNKNFRRCRDIDSYI